MLLLPQRYVFSSKSQQVWEQINYFNVVVATTKVRIFKQITTCTPRFDFGYGCCCYHKGTYFQANHNVSMIIMDVYTVVVATTKVRIFKQITTETVASLPTVRLLLLPQRYVFSSKSQLERHSYTTHIGCCCYHKGTYFQANHNFSRWHCCYALVVVATTKVRIFKQITTDRLIFEQTDSLLLLPQRYVFSSKSQPTNGNAASDGCCCCYHKGTYFQANHNKLKLIKKVLTVVVVTTKVRIFKQITTYFFWCIFFIQLLLLPQGHVFSSEL